MKTQDLKPLIGKIVCLDMLNRERPVCRITAVTDDYVEVKDPLIFVPTPSTTGFQVHAITYAGPLFEVKTLRMQAEHIVSIIDVPEQMERAYMQHTSGLVTETKPKFIVP